MIKISKTELDGVLLIERDIFVDHRGEYVEIYNEELYRKNGIDIKFIEDDISVSKKNVLRGVHGDDQTWKLVSCLYGKFYLVVVNWDRGSPQFCRWEAFVLSEDNRLQVLVPPKFGNGHLVLSEQVIFHYKQSTYYDRSKQFTILWNDPKLNILWPCKNPILSKRDKSNKA